MLELGCVRGVSQARVRLNLIDALEALKTAWRDASPVARRCLDVLDARTHGDLPRWLAALSRLPPAEASAVSWGACVSIGRSTDLADAAQHDELVAALQALSPWRKGPFRLFGTLVDAEWRSDMKWARVAPHLDLRGAQVLDVGCGNGYYGWRMLEAGAASVTGVDPSLLFVLQHAAVNYYARDPRNLVLPLGLEDLRAPTGDVDVVSSMGVVYHRRDPAAHIRALARLGRPGTVLVLESLVADDGPLVPRGRYARMRNVHVVPDVATLVRWLAEAGFKEPRVVDRTVTTVAEQRATPWMTYQSLADALDPAEAGRTVEGYPAPERVVMIASR